MANQVSRALMEREASASHRLIAKAVSGGGQQWITALPMPCFGNKMSDAVWKSAARFRKGVPVYPAPVLCPICKKVDRDDWDTTRFPAIKEDRGTPGTMRCVIWWSWRRRRRGMWLAEKEGIERGMRGDRVMWSSVDIKMARMPWST